MPCCTLKSAQDAVGRMIGRAAAAAPGGARKRLDLAHSAPFATASHADMAQRVVQGAIGRVRLPRRAAAGAKHSRRGRFAEDVGATVFLPLANWTYRSAVVCR